MPEQNTDSKRLSRPQYLIRYYCQTGDEKAVMESLSQDEQSSLDNIICKLLDNDVKLGISFCTLQEVLARQVSAK
jgi:hypothetical protein